MALTAVASLESGGRSLPDPLPLVGRTAELSTLESLLDGKSAARRVLFLRGEGGVGKSRLVSELADRAKRRSWSLAHGRAYPVETGTPYAIFSDAWLPVLREMEPHTITVLSRGGDAELRLLFPALQTGASALAADASTEPDEFRTRLMWNFAEFVKSYAGRTPVLCILEDLQWADRSSLELVHFLARQTQGAPVVIVCTYNDQERDQSPRLVQAERSLVSIGVADVLLLDPLSRDQVAELVARTFSVETDIVRDFASVLFGWTRGNPFFVEEILKAMASSGRLRQESGTWVGWDSKELGMPGSIRDAILGRMHRCSDEAREMAKRASVLGGRTSYPLLERVGGVDSERALAAVAELRAQRILDERIEDGEVVYDFRHPLVRQTLYEEIGLQEVRVLHGVVAEAIEEIFDDRAEEHADQLAFHFARTDAKDLRAKATRYLVAAGRRALERRADREAIDYLEAALDRTGKGGGEGPAIGDIVPMLARAHTHVGHFDAAAELWESALDELSPHTAAYAAVARTLGLTNVWRGRHEAAERYFRLGLEAAEAAGDQPAKVRLLVARAHGLHELGRGQEALEILGRALPIAEETGEAALLARVHRALTLLRVWVGPPEAAIEHGERAIELARQVGDPGIEFWARWGLAVLTGMRGDTERLREAIREVDALADKMRSPVLRLWTADMALELAHATGDWDAGIAAGEKAIALARALNQRTLLPRLLVWISQIHIARNELERAEELTLEAAEMAGIGDDSKPMDVHRVVPAYIGLAHYKLALGDYEDAIADAERGIEIAEGTGYILWAIHLLLPLLAEACLWAGHIDRAEQVGRRMRAHAERIDHRLGLAWADACDSLVKWKRGDPVGAVGRMRESANALEEIPMLWTATRLRRQLAGRLFEIGELEDGKRELDRVHEVCVRLRAGLELEKCRGMYREVGLRPPPMPSPGGPMGLTATETLAAILTAAGLTNGEGSEVLGCAQRTYSTHLYNIYRKLDIGGGGARSRLGIKVRDARLLSPDSVAFFQDAGIDPRASKYADRLREAGLLE
jgi:tetratricopeptide (TPR) repeat protein/DNA-binding CsgD family transcriptional regulator